MQIASIWIMGFNTQILGHILVIFSELASQKWSYFGHIFAKFGHILGHILGVNLVIFWKNLGGNPGLVTVKWGNIEHFRGLALCAD